MFILKAFKFKKKPKNIIKYNKVLKSLLAGCRSLEKSGCKFIVIPCNTAHYWYEDLQNKINVPIINMPKEVFKFTKKNCKKNSKIGLLATEGTLKTQIYNQHVTGANLWNIAKFTN